MWTTAHELGFLDGIGEWFKGQIPTTQHKLALLQGYKRGLSLRRSWAGLNREEILLHVDNLIAEQTALLNDKQKGK